MVDMANEKLDVSFDRIKLGIKSKSEYKYYFYYDIVKIFSDSRYSVIKTSDSKLHYVDVPIKLFEKCLPLIFFKYHRSGIVNLGYMQKYSIENRKIKIYLEDDSSHFISRYSKDIFFRLIQNLNNLSLPCETCKTCTKRVNCPEFEPFIT
jgi:DNA-binding LytR/AlgR family response regulator